MSSKRSQELCTGTMGKKAPRHFRNGSTHSSQARGHEIGNPFQRLTWEGIQDARLAPGSFRSCLFYCAQPSRHKKVTAVIIQAHVATDALMGTLASPMHCLALRDETRSPGATEASTKTSKGVRQFVVEPSSLWATPEKGMGKAVRVTSKLKLRP